MIRSLLVVLAVFLSFTPLQTSASKPADPSKIAATVARWLEKGHYTRERLDDSLSTKFLETYLTALDYNRLYFTQQDIDEFRERFGERLDEATLSGNLDPAREIFSRYKQRVQDRVEKNRKLLEEDFTFESDRTVQMNRRELPWPADEKAADALWRDIVEAEMLRETLNEFKVRTPKESLERRYRQVLRNVQEMDDEDVVKVFLSSLAQTYDPHSEYLSPSDMENFQIQMRLSLVGVGAVLRSEDGYAKVMEVVPGGPADRDGRLRVNDRIAAVAQGDKEFEEVVDMKLDKVVEKIRGEKGTVVKLMILPGDATDPSVREVIDITRDEVKLKDQEAKAELLELKSPEGTPTKVGWITLPSFYANMDGRGSGKSKSTTADVSALLSRLKKEGMEGLVIDLRRDGGGSLEEAINLTGLFIPHGPVVQAKDSNGKITVSQDTDRSVAYDGPLVVLMNRLSASASEIFAAALQDYGRAVIVGDKRSFGKGTVQTVLELGRLMMPFSLSAIDAGALKLTIQKFYRVKGGSTQLNGVESDIVLPSLTDNADIGEEALENELAYDEVAPLRISAAASRPLYIAELRERSLARVKQDPEFTYIQEDVERLNEKILKNEVSLNLEQRKNEIETNKQRKEERKTARKQRGEALDVVAYELTLDDVDAKSLRPVAYNRERKSEKYADPEEEGAKEEEEIKPDPIRDEAVRIIEDLIEMSRQPKTAKSAAS